ncbi:hypothetical protein DPEC_G00328380 [Dallia pectoralis]|uniref:Uncharacterized protein n=1 Tax=Dallia pectoralis TaxID=75939 RepID=A0ACC2F8B5_DALPE|nr:hypothetical protein DPEC_G00328380 [Dallia pectoralis]
MSPCSPPPPPPPPPALFLRFISPGQARSLTLIGPDGNSSWGLCLYARESLQYVSFIVSGTQHANFNQPHTKCPRPGPARPTALAKGNVPKRGFPAPGRADATRVRRERR